MTKKAAAKKEPVTEVVPLIPGVNSVLDTSTEGHADINAQIQRLVEYNETHKDVALPGIEPRV